jgi:endonuclease YncB( thermonuclease family)
MRFILLSLVFFSLMLLPVLANEKAVTKQTARRSGKVVGVIDGDTYDVLVEGRSIRVRMEGIDAPERGMPYYKAAKQHLSVLCFGKQITLVSTGKDHHKRTLGFAYLTDGRELSREMLKAGYAWHYKKYNSDPALAQLEVVARQNRRGLWAESMPMPPWEHRAIKRKGKSKRR